MKKIIIAINNDFIRETYLEVFKGEGFEVLQTKNGKEILNLAKEEKPDLIIIDIDLPEIGGFEILEIIKKEEATQKIPVIIFTQIEKKENRMKAIEL